MIYKDFGNETEARFFRDAKRQGGLAASLFTYGKDRFRVKVIETTADRNPSWAQRYLSNQALDVSNDIRDLNKVKTLIANPDFGYDIEDVVFVAKYLNKEEWFKYPKDVISFFDGISEKEIVKIKTMVDTALQEYEEDWNNKEGVS